MGVLEDTHLAVLGTSDTIGRNNAVPSYTSSWRFGWNETTYKYEYTSVDNPDSASWPEPHGDGYTQKTNGGSAWHAEYIKPQEGYIVSGVGDFDGDGYGDFITGMSHDSIHWESPKLHSGDALREGTHKYVSIGGAGFGYLDNFGSSLSSAGDVNGDGLADLVIGGSDSLDSAGTAVIIFGRKYAYLSDFDVNERVRGSNDFIVDGVSEGDKTGYSVSGAGDVNGDGFDDIIIGAPGADPAGIKDAGSSYVIFGKSNGFAPEVYLEHLDGSNGFRIDGVNTEMHSGYTVSSAGDVNGDGFDDVLIGESGWGITGPSSLSQQAGGATSYVVFGKSSGFEATLSLSSLNGSNGLIVHGSDAYTSESSSTWIFNQESVPSAAGDVNGDGFDDFIITSPKGFDGEPGDASSYLVFGAADLSASPQYKLSVSGEDGHLFTTLEGGRLATAYLKSVDYEEKDTYNVTVTASSLVPQSDMSWSTDFVISVTDVPESPTRVNVTAASPHTTGAYNSGGNYYAPHTYDIIVSEGYGTGTVVGRITVTDPDNINDFDFIVDSGKKQWVMGSGNYGKYGYSPFHVNSNQELVYIGSSDFDFEERGAYDVRVIVRDLLVDKNPTKSVYLQVVVSDVNEAPTSLTLSSSDVAEGYAPPPVGTITVTDPDADDSHTLTVSGTDSDLFEIASDQLKLRSGVRASYETKSSYNITVTATDSGGLSKSQDFTIAVAEVNEAPTDITISGNSIVENSAGFAVGTITVTDPDAGDSHTLTVSGTDANLFEIASDQLKLRSGVSADYENKSSYSVTVKATDSGGLSKSQDFTIDVTDVYEAPPTAINLSNATVAEHYYGQIVGTLSVTDADSESGHSFILSGDDKSYFEITDYQLKLKSSWSTDFERKSSYNITVTGTDSTNLSKSQPFTIKVVDRNERPSISLDNNNITSSEDGALVGLLQVIDPDIDDTHTLTLSGSDADLFEVSNNYLKLRSGVSADYENKSSYSVTVTATDSGDLSGQATFDIVAEGVHLDNNTIAENTTGRFNSIPISIGELSVDGLDTKTLTWSTSGRDADLFQVSNNYLKLRSGVELLDYETQSSYSVTITAKDAAGQTRSGDFNIAVTNVNEAPSNITIDYNEDIIPVPGAVIGTLIVTDPDIDDTHSFEVLTTNAIGIFSRAFEVDEDNQLKFTDYLSEANISGNKYYAYIKATEVGEDRNKLSKSIGFTIEATQSAPKKPTAITLDNNTIAENSIGAVVGTILVTDPNKEDTHTLSLTGSDASLFEIVDDQLKLKSTVSADFEAKSTYSVTVVATDSSDLVYQDSFTIGVTDINEKLAPNGTAGNDKLTGFSGIESIDGGGGVDRVDYSLLKNNVSFSLNADDQIVIQGSTDQSDTLTSVERIHFADTVYALDTGGNAGVAAKAIIVTFGAGSISTYMSAALSVVDSGTSLEALCDLVVELKLIDDLVGSSSNAGFVGQVFNNVVGRSPNLLESKLYTSYLDNGTYTKSSLLALAANTTLAENLVTANSIDLIGVAGSADGEILAFQYDIGLG